MLFGRFEDEEFEAGAEVYEHAVARLEAEREAKLEAVWYEAEAREAEEEDRRRYPGGRCNADAWGRGPRCVTAEEDAIPF